MNVLGIIPARGGSRGIPLKNLAVVCGKTLLRRAIEGAQAAKRIDRLIVSTDCDEIAVEAERCGATVEMRPAELAVDNASTLSVLLWHVHQADVKPDSVLCLQPTCPLRRPSDIDGAIGMLEHTCCDSVVSYFPVEGDHPARMATINDFDRTVTVLSECFAVREGGVNYGNVFAQRQKLQVVYQRSGDIYLTRTPVLLSGSLTGQDQRAWIVPKDRKCNVDSAIDLVIAGALLEYHNGE